MYEGPIIFQNVQNLNYSSKIKKKLQKKFLVSEIIASELVSLICTC